MLERALDRVLHEGGDVLVLAAIVLGEIGLVAAEDEYVLIRNLVLPDLRERPELGELRSRVSMPAAEAAASTHARGHVHVRSWLRNGVERMRLPVA
jgi:hypothetical protein